MKKNHKEIWNFNADLRWNNVGIIGGNSLLDLLKTNTTLSKLDLQANHVPKEILKLLSLRKFPSSHPWEKPNYDRNGGGETGPT